MKQLAILLIALCFITSCKQEKQIEVLATTSWTAAFAKSAGAIQVETLAPSSLLHPSEYELQVSDIQKIKNAKFIVYGGYEVMMKEIMEIIDTTQQQLIQINTGYSLKKLSNAIHKIGFELNTSDIAQQNIDSLQVLVLNFKQLIAHLPKDKQQVSCHFFQQDLVRETGLEVINTFGPQPLEAYDFKALNDDRIDLIIDNVHNPIAKPLEEVLKVKRIELINFPGVNETESLMDVLNYNLSAISEAIH